MKKIASLVMVALALVGCATVRSVRSDKAVEYPGVPYEDAFKAVKSVYSDLNAGIEWALQDQGILIGKAKANWTAADGTAQTAYTNYEAAFTNNPDSVRIRMKIYTAFEDGNYRVEGTQEMYDEFWGRLDKALGQ
jgi:uncharacterized protein YceK